MEEGEQYLSVVLFGSVKVPVFKNKTRKNENSPHFVGNGVSVWVNKKKPEQPTIQTEEVIV